MKKLLYPACFYPCEDKPGAYTVVVPDLPGCISEGDSLEDAIAWQPMLPPAGYWMKWKKAAQCRQQATGELFIQTARMAL